MVDLLRWWWRGWRGPSMAKLLRETARRRAEMDQREDGGGSSVGTGDDFRVFEERFEGVRHRRTDLSPSLRDRPPPVWKPLR